MLKKLSLDSQNIIKLNHWCIITPMTCQSTHHHYFPLDLRRSSHQDSSNKSPKKVTPWAFWWISKESHTWDGHHDGSPGKDTSASSSTLHHQPFDLSWMTAVQFVLKLILGWWRSFGSNHFDPLLLVSSEIGWRGYHGVGVVTRGSIISTLINISYWICWRRFHWIPDTADWMLIECTISGTTPMWLTLTPGMASTMAPPNLASETPNTNFFIFFGKLDSTKFLDWSETTSSKTELMFDRVSTVDVKGQKVTSLMTLLKLATLLTEVSTSASRVDTSSNSFTLKRPYPEACSKSTIDMRTSHKLTRSQQNIATLRQLFFPSSGALSATFCTWRVINSHFDADRGPSWRGILSVFQANRWRSHQCLAEGKNGWIYEAKVALHFDL